jgi:hypothetical protein
MKTSMQEFLDYMKEYNMILVKEGIEPNLLISMLQHKAEKLLEKEKEQMIVFGKKMQLVQHVSYDDDITYCFEPEEYYNQTYNQNEI